MKIDHKIGFAKQIINETICIGLGLVVFNMNDMKYFLTVYKTSDDKHVVDEEFTDEQSARIRAQEIIDNATFYALKYT